MAALVTTVTTINDTDFNDAPITFKQTTSTIGGKDTGIITSSPSSDTDQQAIDAHVAQLTALDYIFD